MNSCGEQRPEQRSDRGDPRIAPVAAALVADRDQRVDDARRKVAGGVERIARRAAQCAADDQDDQRYGKRTDRSQPDRDVAFGRRKVSFRDIENSENLYECSAYLTQ